MEFNLDIFMGLGIGLATFLIIGLFHPLVVWLEYHFTSRSWWVFLVSGILGIVGSIFVDNLFFSALLGVFSFSSFWSIKEVIEQKERVEKGWFPENPKRKK